MWFDLCCRTEEVEETVKLAEKIGWKGLGFIIRHKPGALAELKKRLKGIKGLDLAAGLELKVPPGKVKKTAKDIRKSVELVVVYGGDTDVNRAAVECPEVDVLAHPWKERRDPGVDYIMAKLAKKNNVALEINFNEMLYSSKKSRVQLMHNMLEASKLWRKAGAPIVFTSGAQIPWDLRSPSDLLSFGKILGFQDPEVKKGLSDKILKENRKRLSGKWVMPGVEIE